MTQNLALFRYVARPYTPVSNDADVGRVEFIVKTSHGELTANSEAQF